MARAAGPAQFPALMAGRARASRVFRGARGSFSAARRGLFDILISLGAVSSIRVYGGLFAKDEAAKSAN